MISVGTGGGTRARAYARSSCSSAAYTSSANTSSANTSSARTTYATSSLVEFEAHRRCWMMLIPRKR